MTITSEPACRRNDLQPRLRRFQRALADLGLLDIVGTEFATIEANGFGFGEVTDRQFDRLVCSLEDLARGVIADAPQLSRAQIALDFDAVRPPALLPTFTSSVHMVVPS
jgi:hypothetical protein